MDWTDWTDEIKKINALYKGIERLTKPLIDPKALEGLYQTARAFKPPEALETIRKLVMTQAFWIAQYEVLNYFKRLSAIAKSFVAYSQVAEEVYKIYSDPDKRKSYLDEIIEHCPKTFSTYFSQKKDYADYILLLTTQKLLELPLGYLPKSNKELFDEIKSYVVYRVSTFFSKLDLSPTEQVSVEEYIEVGREEELGTSEGAEEVFFEKEEIKEKMLSEVSYNFETVIGYISQSPEEDKDGWVKYALGLNKKSAFGDRRKEDRATKRMQRRLTEEEYQVFRLSLLALRETMADVRAMVEVGILEKELVLSTLRESVSKSKSVDYAD